MKTPSYELGIQLDRNWVALKARLGPEEAQRLNENFDLVHGIARGDVKRMAPVLLKPIASSVSIPEAPAVKIADCFKVGDGVYAYRDPDFDRWLPKEVQAVGAGMASTFELSQELTFQGMVRMHVGGFTDELEKALIQKDKCWSPKQIDEAIRNCEKGQNPLKLWTDGYANFFFIEIGGHVFAVDAYRSPYGWNVNVYEFADAHHWLAEDRVSFRNYLFSPAVLWREFSFQ